DAEGAFFDEAGTAELRGRGRGTREERAGPDGYDDVVRKPPPELLCALEEERLRPFGVVRAEREVHESPSLLVREPGTQPVDLVVRPVHAYDRRAVRCGPRDLAFVGRGRHEYHRAQPVACRGCRDRTREVAGRCTGERFEPKLERARERERNGPVLERQRWVARVVFEEESRHADRCAEARRLHERRPANGEMPARRGDREERRVAPERERATLDLVAKGLCVERRQVVLRLDRAVALSADIEFVGRRKCVTRAAAQAAEMART